MRVQRLATTHVLPKLSKFGGPYLPHHWSDWPNILDLVLWVPKQHVYQVSLKSETVGFKFSVILGDLTRNDPNPSMYVCANCIVILYHTQNSWIAQLDPQIPARSMD